MSRRSRVARRAVAGAVVLGLALLGAAMWQARPTAAAACSASRVSGLFQTLTSSRVVVVVHGRRVRYRLVRHPRAVRADLGSPISLSSLRPHARVQLVVRTCRKPVTRSVTAVRALGDIHQIKHVIFVMQENRSFDSYFGTYPGAAGFPKGSNGQFTVCVPDPKTGACVKPYRDTSDTGPDLPHDARAATIDIDGGKMDGFIKQTYASQDATCSQRPQDPLCSDPNAGDRSMGYHDATEIPNYWTYARRFVLQDHMFEPNLGWSLPAHLFMVSAWSAKCSNPLDAMTCTSDLSLRGESPSLDGPEANTAPHFGWTDITYLLHKRTISWAYYVAPGTQPDCDDGLPNCSPKPQSAGTPEIWNPLRDFVTVHDDRQVGNIVGTDRYFEAAKNGTLPAVSWIVPTQPRSEHPPAKISAGQAWVTSLVNAAMRGPDWKSTAVFVSWDDWGGFYDHVAPPQVDGNGYGIRVPGLVISAYAKTGYVDHQTLSFDAYLRFIERDFLSDQALDPKTDGRPDARPTVRERVPQLGDLRLDFDFSQPPRRPVLLPEQP